MDLNDQLTTLYHLALLDNPKTAQYKKRSYDVISRTWDKIQDSEDPMETPEWDRLSKSQKEKLREFIEIGEISAVTLSKSNPRLSTLREFLGVYGIGPAKAIALIDAGYKTIKDLNTAKLTKSQALGVRYYSDLKKRIPRKQIEGLHQWLKAHTPKSLRWMIVGSYRRGSPTSGDVDIMVTGEGRADLIRRMQAAGILHHALASGKTKYMGLGTLPGSKVMRHLDIIETTAAQFPFTTLYFTGPADWNIRMRHQANTRGFRLNEHNYTHIKTGKPVSEKEYMELIGKPEPTTEKDVCDVIGWKYKSPTERGE